MPTQNIRTEFEKSLKTLQEEVLVLGSMVSEAIKLSVEALKTRDEKLAQQVIADESKINTLRYNIENACITTIAQQQPVARDLRMVIAVLNIIPDLERMGDHAAGIAKIAIEMQDQPPLKPLVDIPRMADTCRDMLSQSLNAFLAKDVGWAAKIMEMDQTLDELHVQVFRELISFMIEDPSKIGRAMYLIFVSHNLERIGDRVENICERVTFLNTGRIEESPKNSVLTSKI
jgi:phosphate transport system protein